MSLDLVDLKRLKVTRETRAALYGKSLQTNRTPQEIARDVLHAWALGEFDGAKVMSRLDPREGTSGDSGGRSNK